MEKNNHFEFKEEECKETSHDKSAEEQTQTQNPVEPETHKPQKPNETDPIKPKSHKPTDSNPFGTLNDTKVHSHRQGSHADYSKHSIRIGEDLLSLEVFDPSSDSDTVVDKSINQAGINSYSLKVYLIISLFFMADGGEMIVVSLLVERLGGIWHLSSFQKGLMGAVVFVGFFIGSLSSGRLADIKGRKPTFIYGAIIVASFAFISSLSPNYYFLISCRSCSGFGIGLAVPAATSLAAEITPTSMRAWVLNLVWLFFPIGEIATVLVAERIIYNYEPGWRFLLVCVGVPSILNFLVSFSIAESPRYYLATKQYEAAYGVLDKIRTCGNLSPLTEEEKKTIKKENEEKPKPQEGEKKEEKEETPENAKDQKEKLQGFSALLAKEFLCLIVLCSLIFFICSFVYYGIVYILPQAIKAEADASLQENLKAADQLMEDKHDILLNESVLNSSYSGFEEANKTQNFSAVNGTNSTTPSQASLDKMFHGILFSAVCEIPTPIGASFIANIPFLGRKRSMALSFLLTCVAALLCSLFIQFLNIIAAVLKLFIAIVTGLIYVYVCEAFPTKVRSMAVGVSNSCQRLAGIITPLVTQLLFSFGISMPFFSFALLSFTGVVISLSLPFETLGKNIK